MKQGITPWIYDTAVPNGNAQIAQNSISGTATSGTVTSINSIRSINISMSNAACQTTLYFSYKQFKSAINFWKHYNLRFDGRYLRYIA